MNLDRNHGKLFFAAGLAIQLAAGVSPASRTGFILPLSLPAVATLPSPAGAPSLFSPDKGKLRITIDGQPVGSEDFEISESGDAWIERSSMSALLPADYITSKGDLNLPADQKTIRYDWSAE